MPWLLLIIKTYIGYIRVCIRHSEGPISRPVTHGCGTSYPQPCEKLPVSSADNRCRRFDPGQARWHSDGIPERTF